MYTEIIEYVHRGTTLEGYLAYEGPPGARAGVLVFHDWMGLGDFVKGRAERLAALGYVAFAADVYGKGIRPADREQAAAQAAVYRADRSLMRARARVALDVLAIHALVDPRRLAAIGYCFGGGVALELARAGAPLGAVVSFHGNLDTPHPEDAQNIKAAVLALHGADDPLVPPAQVEAFQAEMRAAGVDWQLVVYGGAVHGFTNPEAGADPGRGVAYDARAAERSWTAMLAFFREILR